MRMQVVDRSGEVLRIEPFSVETAAPGGGCSRYGGD